MKKGFIFFLIFCLFNLSVFAMDSASVEETIQIIQWEDIENASKYQVDIEKLETAESENNNIDLWQPFYSEITSLSQVEVTFIPGRYRINVKPVNILGKVVDQGLWLRFRILTQEEWEIWNKEHNSNKNQPIFEEDFIDFNQKEDPKKHKSIWFTAIRIGLDVPVDQLYNFTFNTKVSADIIGTDWFYWNAGFVFSPIMIGTILNYDWGFKYGIETSANFRIPLDYVKPYGGLVAGYYFSEDMYGSVVIGAEILKYVDVKVYFTLDDILNQRDFSVSAGIGGIIPLK